MKIRDIMVWMAIVSTTYLAYNYFAGDGVFSKE
jgi:hypothetical protein